MTGSLVTGLACEYRPSIERSVNTPMVGGDALATR